MKYNYNGKAYNVPDNEIDKIMDKLDCSIADACEMWLSDHDVIENEQIEELTKKATKNRITATIHNAKGEKKERKPREKKENPLKKEIIGRIFELFKVEYGDLMQVSLRNDEKYIDLTIDGREFTVNLVEHRKKKES